MDRKEACERIILLPSEKHLLNKIRRNKNRQCSGEDVETLMSYGLIEPKYEMVGGFTVPSPTDSYHVTEFYAVYAAYRRREWLDYIADKWIDIFASLISLVSLIMSVIALLR